MFILVSIQERRGVRGEKSGLKGKERKEEEGEEKEGLKVELTTTPPRDNNYPLEA